MSGLPDNWITLEFLGTYTGMVLFVSIATAFIKEPFKQKWGHWFTRVVAMVIALLTQLFYIAVLGNINLESVGLAVVNSVLIAAAASGTHEFISDPRALKVDPMKLEAMKNKKTV